MKASDLFVRALEQEEVEYIFGIPGEENLDILESLRNSSIKLILTRHEQGAGFMAATYRSPDRQGRRLHVHPRPWGHQSRHSCGLCPTRRHANPDDHRSEADQKKNKAVFRSSILSK